MGARLTAIFIVLAPIHLLLAAYLARRGRLKALPSAKAMRQPLSQVRKRIMLAAAAVTILALGLAVWGAWRFPRDPEGRFRRCYPGYCSFCRKSYRDVGPLVEGPDLVFICSNCIDLCRKVIEDERRVRGKPSPDADRAADHKEKDGVGAR